MIYEKDKGLSCREIGAEVLFAWALFETKKPKKYTLLNIKCYLIIVTSVLNMSIIFKKLK